MTSSSHLGTGDGEPAVPVRLRLSRAKGFDLQALSRAINGLPAIAVGRPGRWGNQFRIEAHEDGTFRVGHSLHMEQYREEAVACSTMESARRAAVEAFGQWTESENCTHFRLRASTELRGHNLACWCAAGDPCHADVLLRLARTPDRGGDRG